MKCHEFERDLPEWTDDRLPAAQAQRMQAHHDICASCQRLTRAEQSLRLRWDDLPTPPAMPMLWPRLEQRILQPPPHRRPLFSSVSWAMSSALAAAILIGGVMRWQTLQSPPSEFTTTATPIPVVAQVDEQRIVQRLNDLQSLPDSESDSFFSETQQDRHVQRQALLGKGGN